MRIFLRSFILVIAAGTGVSLGLCVIDAPSASHGAPQAGLGKLRHAGDSLPR